MAEWPEEQYGESEIHSFIVRIWMEEIESVPERNAWHGRIVYLESGEQRYFRDLKEIPGFIQAHLDLDSSH